MAGELQTKQDQPLTLIDCRISTLLWSKLSDSTTASLVIEEIVSDPVLRAEARAVAPMLERTIIGAGADGVRRALQAPVVVYGVGEAARSPAFWGAYVRSLSDIPEVALREAVDDYIASADAEFFPKPGPLRALALKRAAPAFQAVGRVREVLKAAPRKPIDRGTAEQRRAAVADLLRGMRRSA